jgi:hypothetical protein
MVGFFLRIFCFKEEEDGGVMTNKEENGGVMTNQCYSYLILVLGNSLFHLYTIFSYKICFRSNVGPITMLDNIKIYSK